MTLELEYYVRFGSGDCSDTFDWEVELTPEEEAAMKAALAEDEDLELVLADAVSRAYDEIFEQEKANFDEMDEEWSEGWSLEVNIVYPEEIEEDEDAFE
jgi:hypothetical protein